MTYNIIELNEKLTTELRVLARSMGIRRPDAYKKEELIYKILDEQAIAEAETQNKKPRTPNKGANKKEEHKNAPSKQNKDKGAEPTKHDDRHAKNKDEQNIKAQQKPKEADTKKLPQKQDAAHKGKQEQNAVQKQDKPSDNNKQQKPKQADAKPETQKDKQKGVDESKKEEQKDDNQKPKQLVFRSRRQRDQDKEKSDNTPKNVLPPVVAENEEIAEKFEAQIETTPAEEASLERDCHHGCKHWRLRTHN